MIKEIKYNGLTETPSDYECPDGDLATSMQLINENGALHPVLPPKVVFELPEGRIPVFLHKGNDYKNYIVQQGLVFYWYNKNQQGSMTEHMLHTFTNTDICEVNAIGNTLLVLTSKGMHYFLWKDEAYKYLGAHLPELPISFGLQGEMKISDEAFGIEFYDIDDTLLEEEFSDQNKTFITDQVLGKVNKFIAEESVNKGKFIFPFFVRYAYRLYDQNLTMHSPPVLMVCSSGLTPQCMVRPDTITGGGGHANAAALYVAAMVHQLEYFIEDSTAVNAIKDWKDIITSVDIFISKPIYTYDQSGKCSRFADSLADNIYSVCKDIGNAGAAYQKNIFSDLYATHASDYRSDYKWRLLLPQREDEDIANDIKSESLFYLLKSIEVGELETGSNVVSVSKEHLQSLTNREVMTDDYDTHDALMSRYSYVYNGRMNISGITKEMFEGFHPDTLFEYTNGNQSVTVYYHMVQDGKEIVVSGGTGTYRSNTPYLYLYHPNNNVYKAVVKVANTCYEVQMKHHPMLNGAYYFSGWDGITETERVIQAAPILSMDRTVELPNKIYTSEVNNPFLYPAKGINTIGVGKIIGIRAATKAMSQGQFGQFPLYVFTDEGVWAMEVNKEGKYSSSQPVTRDVCCNPSSITQIDTSVLFATARGIMLASGATSVCISDDINSESPFAPIAEAETDDVLKALRNITPLPVNRERFLDFVKDCRMIYDYTHQRIVCYADGYDYAYVYAMKSKRWGLMKSTIITHMNSYPESLALIRSSVTNPIETDEVVDFCEYDYTQRVDGLLITRPLKLDAPDLLKTIDTVIQRGYFRKGHVKTILYGSRDLFNWKLIYSSTDHYLRGFRGTPYKYFRIALLCSLTKDESIFGCTVQYTPRLLNQPR